MNRWVPAARRPRHPCQDFAAILPATRGLIAAPWTPLASLCSAGGQRLTAVALTESEPIRALFLSAPPASVLGPASSLPPKEIVYE
jgi:hypothetical protein